MVTEVGAVISTSGAKMYLSYCYNPLVSLHFLPAVVCSCCVIPTSGMQNDRNWPFNNISTLPSMTMGQV